MEFMPIPATGPKAGQSNVAEPARPVVAERSRNGCELRRTALMTDSQGNVTELKTASPASMVHELTQSVASLRTELDTMMRRVDALGKQIRQSDLAGNRAPAEPPFLPPKPYFAD